MAEFWISFTAQAKSLRVRLISKQWSAYWLSCPIFSYTAFLKLTYCSRLLYCQSRMNCRGPERHRQVHVRIHFREAFVPKHNCVSLADEVPTCNMGKQLYELSIVKEGDKQANQAWQYVEFLNQCRFGEIT